VRNQSHLGSDPASMLRVADLQSVRAGNVWRLEEQHSRDFRLAPRCCVVVYVMTLDRPLAGVTLRTYNVIYDLVDDVRAAMEGRLNTVEERTEIGEAEVRRRRNCQLNR
jgi:ABC-type branched-subunit amino acid transport system ATPase component